MYDFRVHLILTPPSPYSLQTLPTQKVRLANKNAADQKVY